MARSTAIAGHARRDRAGSVIRVQLMHYPDHRHAVVALPDSRRGERLVLVSEAPQVTRDALVNAAHREGLPEIAIPRDVVRAAALPLLGSGKTDYAAVLQLATEADAARPRDTGDGEVSSLVAS